jgi:voltage-gated potassium channel
VTGGTRPSPDEAAMSAMAQIARGLFTAGGGDLSYGTLKQGFRELVQRDPLDSLLATVLGGSYLFYLAEKGKNPKVKTLWDAVVFISTSVSVGYDDVFARTESGKAIASFVMTFGPAMAASVFNPPASAPKEPVVTTSPEALEALALQRSILERLDAILEAMKKAPEAATASPTGA